MTEEQPRFFGHETAMGEVQAAYASGRMPHAWLISGIEGIGKATLAKHIAMFALSNGRGALGHLDPQNPVAKLVEAETHPDLLIIRRPLDEKTEMQRALIPVEEVLKIATFLHKTATHGGWRVVVIDEAHTLNRNGQNAILKIVEEPPPRTLILITVTTPGALLPTIRSRARVLQLSPLGAEDMRSILKIVAPQTDADEASEVIALSGGSAGFALKILRTETLPLYRDMLALLNAMPQLDMASLHKLADQVARKTDAESFEVLSTLLVERLRQVALDQAHQTPVGRVDTALQLWDRTRAVFTATDISNLDRKLAFISVMTDIRAAMA